MRKLSILALFALLSACATAVGTNYGPADAKGYGYSATQIEDNRFRIVFRGDGATPGEVVEDYALLRAGEIAIERGFDWFRLVSSSLDVEERGGVDVGAGVGTGSYGRSSGVSLGVGGNLGTIGSRAFYTARLEVLYGKGPAPDDGEAYEARSVVDAIRARMTSNER